MKEFPIAVLVFRRQVSILELTMQQWAMLIKQTRAGMLLAKLYYLLEEQSIINNIPIEILRHFYSARVLAEKQNNDLLWELSHIKKIAEEIGFSFVLLKGSAYAAVDHFSSRGRFFSDIDLLVPENKIDLVEKYLILNGWMSLNKNAYDQRYYRQWMHEIPPLQHVFRGSVVDLHHNILPRTSRACPDPKLFIQEARDVDNHKGLMVLSPIDMLVHSATHLFYEGDFEHGLRDLLDLNDLLDHLDVRDVNGLINRSSQLGLQRPVFYALHYLSIILNSLRARCLLEDVTIEQPSKIQLKIMDFLFLRALMPMHSSCDDRWTGLARWLLYIRAHWLKMPLYLLIPHLIRKAWMRLIGKEHH